MSQTKAQYSLHTAISMVVGIVIGSGIFFKADDVLRATNGNIILGALAFLFVGLGLVFGSLVISQYALRNDGEGGIIAYSVSAYGRFFGYIVGWFMAMIYFPCLITILGVVVAIYMRVLLNLNDSYSLWGLTIFFIITCFTSNIMSAKMAGKIQIVATVLKLIPLAAIGLFGLFFNGSTVESTMDISALSINDNAGFLSALILVAFTFDGWIIATSISAEIPNPKRNMPLALVFGCGIITLVYVLYFIGISNLLSPQIIIATGDAHVNDAAQKIFGIYGGKLLTLFIVISVYGALNGLILATLRMPHALVANNLMKDVFKINQINTKFDFSLGTILFSIIPTILFLILHKFSTMEGNYFYTAKFDVSNLPIILMYVFYIILYVGVFKLIKTDHTPKYYSYFILLACFIAMVILYGSLQTNALLYSITSLIILGLSVPFYKRDNNKN